jgi:hypothetical protein
MDEKPPNAWRRPWNTPGRIAAWFLLLIVSAFAVICAIVVLTDSNVRASELIPFALALSIAIGVGALALFWLIRSVSSWKNFRRFLFVVACVVTFILLAYAEENWRGKHAWDSYRHRWEAQGEKFSPADFVPAPVPDDKNFALTPLLKPALEIMRQVDVARRDTNALARLDRTSAELSGGPGKRHSLEAGNVEKGTFADLAAWAEFYRGNTNYPQASPNASPAEVILVALAKTDPEMKELREAAAMRPYSRFPIQYDYEPPWAILLPHLTHVKRLTILAHVRAIAELESGRAAEAFEDLKLAFRLSDSVRDEPFAIDHLVRIATLNISLQVVREGLARHAWTDSQLAEIEKNLGSIDLLAEYKHVMRGEQAFETAGLDHLRRRGPRTRPGMVYSDVDVVDRPMPSGWFYQNMLTISEIDHEFVFPSVNEQAHRVFPDITDKQEKAVTQMRTGPYTIFAKLLLPALQTLVLKPAHGQTMADAARVACALERYRQAKGTLPATLDVLTPAFIDQTPTDVIDGRPLRYRVDSSNGHYVLYSIGWNRVDNGGELGRSEKVENKSRVDETRGDWVWTNFAPK